MAHKEAHFDFPSERGSEAPTSESLCESPLSQHLPEHYPDTEVEIKTQETATHIHHNTQTQ